MIHLIRGHNEEYVITTVCGYAGREIGGGVYISSTAGKFRAVSATDTKQASTCPQCRKRLNIQKKSLASMRHV